MAYSIFPTLEGLVRDLQPFTVLTKLAHPGHGTLILHLMLMRVTKRSPRLAEATL